MPSIAERASPIRVRCGNPELLLGRCLVSGVHIMEPEEAAASGYGERITLRPKLPARLPTDAELQRIIAAPDTPPEHIMYLRRLPAGVTHRILGQAIARHPVQANSPRIVIEPGVQSMYLGMTHARGNQLSTTVDPESLNPLTGEPIKVGSHIDSYRHENPATLRLAGINIGPGARYFHIAPEITREHLGGAAHRSSEQQAEYVRRTALDCDPAAFYWFRLGPPETDSAGNRLSYEAYTNAPVAWHSHDGSTYGSPAPSSAAFVLSRGLLPLEAFPSLVE